jgi:hypothetical protein
MNFFMLSKTMLVFAAASSAVFFPATAAAKIERTVEKTFQVQSGAKLSVRTTGGKVRVEPGDVQSVRIVARQIFPKANTDADADAIAKSLDLVMEQSGNSVSASAKYVRSAWGRASGYVEFDVTVPRSCDATLTTSGGDVIVGDIAGAVHARTSGGDVKLGRIGGPVDARTSGGDVTLAGCAQNAALVTSGGNVEAGPAAGDLQITTSGGNIRINGVGGAVNARTSGGTINANLAQISNECVLITSGGEVSVQFDKSSTLLLDAVTNGGRVWAGDNVRIDTLAGGHGKNRLSGKVNGGGPLVKLRASGGNIDVRAR